MHPSCRWIGPLRASRIGVEIFFSLFSDGHCFPCSPFLSRSCRLLASSVNHSAQTKHRKSRRLLGVSGIASSALVEYSVGLTFENDKRRRQKDRRGERRPRNSEVLERIKGFCRIVFSLFSAHYLFRLCIEIMPLRFLLYHRKRLWTKQNCLVLSFQQKSASSCLECLFPRVGIRSSRGPRTPSFFLSFPS